MCSRDHLARGLKFTQYLAMHILSNEPIAQVLVLMPLLDNAEHGTGIHLLSGSVLS